jgi:hypothetical protein
MVAIEEGVSEGMEVSIACDPTDPDISIFNPIG